MAHYIVVYSKYFITLFFGLFLACGFYALRYERPEDQKWTANLQCVFLFLTQLWAWMTIVIRTRRMEYMILFVFLELMTFAVPVLLIMLYPGISRILLNQMCMLLSVGLIVLTRLDINKAVKQLVIAALSFGLSMAVPWLMRTFRATLRRMGWIYAAAGIAAIGLVLILGQVTHGSKISWSLGGITFQPSEFVKLLYVFFIASLLAQDTGIIQVILAGLGAAAHVLILVFSKDLGSALIFFVTYVFMITIGTHHIWYLLAGTAAGAGASVIAFRIFTHVQVRVQAWKDPWSVIDSQGYQITQSLFAMSRGGLFGLGIGKGTPSDIPYVETDFIFSAVVEELGLLFAIGVVLAGMLCFLLIMRLAGSLKDGFYKNLAAGFAVLYLFQTFLTIGGGSKFIPLTGVTLPFISYGGSSVMTTILMFAVVQSIFVLRRDEEIRVEKQRKKNAKKRGRCQEGTEEEA